MSALSEKERESVAIGAAIGAGCRPCTRYHVSAALRAGLTKDDVRLAVRDAEVLRVEAVTSIADFAVQLLGDKEKDAKRLCNPTEPLQALAQVGAATGGNAGHLLDWLLPQARGLGLTNDALEEAVDLATKVKGVAADFFGKDASRALAREVVAAPTGDAVCAEVAQTEAAASRRAAKRIG